MYKSVLTAFLLICLFHALNGRNLMKDVSDKTDEQYLFINQDGVDYFSGEDDTRLSDLLRKYFLLKENENLLMDKRFPKRWNGRTNAKFLSQLTNDEDYKPSYAKMWQGHMKQKNKMYQNIFG
jgi:hypothetical protein